MFQIGLRSHVRIEKAVAIPARKDTGPPGIRHTDALMRSLRRAQSLGDQEWSPSHRVGIAAAGRALPPQRAEEIHQLHLLGCLAPRLEQKGRAYDDGERFRS